jgi:hypothetical protein
MSHISRFISIYDLFSYSPAKITQIDLLKSYRIMLQFAPKSSELSVPFKFCD